MTFSHFVTGFNRHDPDARLSETQRAELAAWLSGIPQLQRAEIGVPAEIQTYHGDTPVPALALRLDFATLPEMEQALDEGGSVYRLARSALWHSLCLDDVSQQAMVRRSFVDATRAGENGCDYLVHYPGQAEDFNSWLRYYLAHHPRIMRSYPEVRAVDVFTRVDWCDALPWPRVACMQRNRIAFAAPEQLLAALTSPVRQQMRQDHGQFPPYSEGSRHYPMLVERVAPGAQSPRRR